MFTIPYKSIVEKIQKKTGQSTEEIEASINQKQETLSGLITKQGAAQIVASENGINIYEEHSGKIKIDKVLAGMRNIDIDAKIMDIYPIKEFTTKDGRSGKVASMFVADETAKIRITLWNELTDIISEVSKGDIISLKKVGSKMNQDRVELTIFNKEQLIINPDGVNIKETVNAPNGSSQSFKPATRKKISDIINNEENLEILGNIVAVYDPRYFETCPSCNKRVREENGSFSCQAHGTVTPNIGAVMNMVVDDGSGSIRCSLFTNQINKLIEFSAKSIIDFREKSFEEIKDHLLGEYIKIIGKAIRSEAFDRIEYRAQVVFLNPDPKKEMPKE